ncbi:MAG: SPASM domain-containing protein [Candidatus Cloacimonadia bacterium]
MRKTNLLTAPIRVSWQVVPLMERLDVHALSTSDAINLINCLLKMKVMVFSVMGKNFNRLNNLNFFEALSSIQGEMELLLSLGLSDIQHIVAKKLRGVNVQNITLLLDEYTYNKAFLHKFNQAIDILRDERLKVNVGFTVTLENYRYLPNIMNLFLNTGINSYIFFLSPSLISLNDVYNWTVNKIHAEKKEKDISIVCQDRFCSSFSDSDNSFTPCAAGRFMCHIESNGDIYPCAEWPLKAGNIKENTFDYIWKNSPEFTQIRRLKIDNDCRKCRFFNQCIGGCIGLFFKNRTALAPSLKCKKIDSLGRFL